MIIKIQGTGNLKKYIPESNTIELPEGSNIKVLKEALKIDNSEKLGFNLNGKMVKEEHKLIDHDKVILIMFVSAG